MPFPKDLTIVRRLADAEENIKSTNKNRLAALAEIVTVCPVGLTGRFKLDDKGGGLDFVKATNGGCGGVEVFRFGQKDSDASSGGKPVAFRGSAGGIWTYQPNGFQRILIPHAEAPNLDQIVRFMYHELSKMADIEPAKTWIDLDAAGSKHILLRLLAIFYRMNNRDYAVATTKAAYYLSSHFPNLVPPMWHLIKQLLCPGKRWFWSDDLDNTGVRTNSILCSRFLGQTCTPREMLELTTKLTNDPLVQEWFKHEAYKTVFENDPERLLM